MCVTARRRRSITLSTTGGGAKMSTSQMIGSFPSAPINKSFATASASANAVPVTPVSSAAKLPPFVRSFNHSASTTSSSSSSYSRSTADTDSAHDCKRRQVVHCYHDHSRDMPSLVPHVTRGGVKTPFPLRLHNMLCGVEAEGLTHIVSWQPHGRSFLVHKTKEFVEDIMPKYFNQGKFASFQRQLNLYGFKRLTRGPDTGSYYNELFLKGRPFLAHDIHRTKVKGNGARAASNPDTEPNFYAMPSLGGSSTTEQQQPMQQQQQYQAIGQPPALPAVHASQLQRRVPIPTPALVSSAMSTLTKNFQQAAAAQQMPLQQQQPLPKQVVSAEDPEWDTTADYLLDVLDTVVESNMDIPTTSCSSSVEEVVARTCSPSIDEIVEVAKQPNQQPSRKASLALAEDGSHAPLPLVSDDEDEAACAAAFYSDDTLDDILAGVDLGSDFELGMILEKMVSEP